MSDMDLGGGGGGVCWASSQAHRTQRCMASSVLSSLYVCMAIKYIIVLFVETVINNNFAVINLRGVSTNKTILLVAYCHESAPNGFLVTIYRYVE